MQALKKNLGRNWGALLLVLGILFACIGQSQPTALPLAALNLTPRETQWINARKTIRIAGPRAFPPFHYYDEKGKLKGIAPDYLSLILDQMGLNITVSGPIPWNRVLEKAKSGEIDLIPCTAMSEERKAYLNFSIPYLSFPLVILTQKDAPFIGGISDLHGKTLAVIEKNASSTWLQRDGLEYTPYPVDSPLKRLEAISLGRVDAGIENLAAASYIIQQYGLTNIKVAAPTPYGNYNLYMAATKENPELLGIINKMLEKITPEHQMKIRNKWLSIRYEHGLRPLDIFKWILAVAVVATAILTVFLVANARLKKEIRARIRAMGELEAAMTEIKTLEGIVPICSSCKKIRDDKGYWNRLEAYIEKHSGASFSHSMCPECAQKFYGKEKWFVRQTASKK